jgi:hypothetical protein
MTTESWQEHPNSTWAQLTFALSSDGRRDSPRALMNFCTCCSLCLAFSSSSPVCLLKSYLPFRIQLKYHLLCEFFWHPPERINHSLPYTGRALCKETQLLPSICNFFFLSLYFELHKSGHIFDSSWYPQHNACVWWWSVNDCWNSLATLDKTSINILQRTL